MSLGSLGSRSLRVGDVAFFRGNSDQVRILDTARMDDGFPGFLVMMQGWSEPQRRGRESLVTYGENKLYIVARIKEALRRYQDARHHLERLVDDLARLLEHEDELA